jgi:hypothetical protein
VPLEKTITWFFSRAGMRSLGYIVSQKRLMRGDV